ncbi:hypothetical protein [Kutzneria sp. NPDC051319]|uniref:hypothetical protein n=1 Tax=Kutzneria sp. NPDC051319 TaxID=3155047 RepID=UPI00341B4023
MTSGSRLHSAHQLRLRLRPKAPRTGYVDGHQRISLLVAPADAAENDAHDALMKAGERGNADSPARLLTVAGILVRGASAEPLGAR